MNERIQELADQSGLYVDLNGRPWPKNMSAEECEAAYKKFAELIVQDGINKILEWKNEPFPFDEHTAVWILKKHFGIEE